MSWKTTFNQDTKVVGVGSATSVWTTATESFTFGPVRIDEKSDGAKFRTDRAAALAVYQARKNAEEAIAAKLDAL